jgi:acetyl esterase
MPLDPNARAILNQLAAINFPSFETLPAVQARAASQMLGKQSPLGPDVGAMHETVIPTRSGSIPARVYVPHGTCGGLIAYFHGGGWVLGDLDSCDSLVRLLVDLSWCAAVSVDYRLAPEHPYPAAVDDAVDAVAWCFDQRRQLAGADVPLIVAGDSAGANLATVAAISDRDAGLHRIALQVLFYPVTDAAMDTPSYAENAEGLLLTRSLMAWFWKHYAQDSNARTDSRCSPLRTEDFSGLPPAFIQTAEYDPLRDEGEAYARRLAEAGVSVTLQRCPGLIHGYAGMYGVIPAARHYVDEAALAIHRTCAVPSLIASTAP